MSQPPIARIRGVSKRFLLESNQASSVGARDIIDEVLGRRNRRKTQVTTNEFWALRDVSFDIKQGEGVGVLGHNGAGKSTLIKILMGSLSPTLGDAEVRGRVGAITQLGTGFNLALTGRQNIFINASMLGFTHRQVESLIDNIIEFADIGLFIDQPMKNYSSGMKARLGYAVCVFMSPDILLVDEVLAVGDLAFKRKCIRHINSLRSSGGSLLFVSHDLHAVQFVCERVLVLEKGRLIFDGDVYPGIEAYLASVEKFDRGSDAEHDAERLEIEAGRRGAETLAHASEEAKEEEGSISNGAPAVVNRDDRQVVENSTPADDSASTPDPSYGENPDFKLSRPPKPLSDNDPLGIRGVRIAPQSGSSLRTGEAAHVTIRIETNRPPEHLGWGFTICKEDGSQIICSALFIEERSVGNVRAGVTDLHADIDELMLLAGRYQLRCGITDYRDGIPFDELGWHDPPIFFEVESDANFYSSVQKLMGCLVTIKATDIHSPSASAATFGEHAQGVAG